MGGHGSDGTGGLRVPVPMFEEPHGRGSGGRRRCGLMSLEIPSSSQVFVAGAEFVESLADLCQVVVVGQGGPAVGDCSLQWSLTPIIPRPPR